MIGYRGCFRYVREPELFASSWRSLARVRERDAEPAPDDPVRPHRVGARGVPRAHRGAARSAASAGCGAGSWPRCRRWCTGSPEYAAHGDRRRVDRVQRPHAADARASTGTPRSAPSCSTRRDPAVLDAIDADRRRVPRGRHHLLAVRAGAVQPARTFAEQLVRSGITSVSVNPDAARRAAAIGRRRRARLLLEAARTALEGDRRDHCPGGWAWLLLRLCRGHVHRPAGSFALPLVDPRVCSDRWHSCSVGSRDDEAKFGPAVTRGGRGRTGSLCICLLGIDGSRTSLAAMRRRPCVGLLDESIGEITVAAVLDYESTGDPSERGRPSRKLIAGWSRAANAVERRDPDWLVGRVVFSAIPSAG